VVKYGVGARIKLRYTRAMIAAALNGRLNNVEYEIHPVFGMAVPTNCTDVPSALLNPRATWTNKYA
jgi:phosphoenolpyruvate carboxykinase (ATP)